MSTKNIRISATKPKSILNQPLKLDVKAFATAIAKGTGHAVLGKFDELTSDASDIFAALGVEGNTPQALLYILLQKSVQSAILEVIKDSKEHLPVNMDIKSLGKYLEEAITDATVDNDFFKNPAKLKILRDIVQGMQKWLEGEGVTAVISKTISQRLPGFFPMALHCEWQKNGLHYDIIRQHLHSPFMQAAEQESAWIAYTARLHQVLEIGVFNEPFGLRQIYVPLSAYYEKQSEKSESTKDSRTLRVVVDLKNELDNWLTQTDKDDALRAISGGPGSGKSSFAKVYAAEVASKGKLKVLFCPLHLIDATRDFSEEIGRFVRDENILKHNPLNPDTFNSDLLIILDGLDELANQGRAAEATARDFVRSVQQLVDRRNSNILKVRVLFCGREVVVQESESEFRRPHQILNVLPYITLREKYSKRLNFFESFEYVDPQNLLEKDLRQVWWKNYGILTGNKYKKLPPELDRDDLVEITTQPLLNYLLALSFCRGKLNFKDEVNLNEIYYDLIEAVYERGYERGRRHISTDGLNLKDFFLVLEEIGLAAWQGDGRTTTVSEIEKHCRDGGLSRQLDAFRNGAKSGITRLLAAFFFRQHGERPKGDPTFVFTHKSFGEFLAARRLVNAMQEIAEERERRIEKGGNRGWSESEALQHWIKLCGPTALSKYINNFLKFEVALIEKSKVINLQKHFVCLFNYLLKHEMPMEVLLLPTFKEALFNSRNAEESLIAALNSCAQRTEEISQIEHPSISTFGAWFKRIQGQRLSSESVIAFDCLSWLNLHGVALHFNDFSHANLRYANMSGIRSYHAGFENSDLHKANLSNAHLLEASFHGANLSKADLKAANLARADLSAANFDEAELETARLNNANLSDSSFVRANLRNVNFVKANLENIDLSGAVLDNSNLSHANLRGAKINGASFRNVNFGGANLEEVDFTYANIEGAKFNEVEP